MAQTQDQQVAAFRNFVILTALGIMSFLLCFYVTGMIVIALLQKRANVIGVMSQNPPDQFWYLMSFMYTRWSRILKNVSKIDFVKNNYYSTKLILGTIIPYGVYFTLIYKYREQIFEFKPFKVSKGGADAHWATLAEIKKAGLMHDGTGMTMGRFKGKLLVVTKENCQHVLLFAPTGSGKGVGFALPNLLFWDDSVIVHDVKLENFEITGGYREKH
ncbi:MAG: type IV secretory system conjugative DNA transfer family protein, partial [Rickettsiales bacterium]|nr:type IV secretory system conjugative DNA transfer family protein [Rickettsiales bacterium]